MRSLIMMLVLGPLLVAGQAMGQEVGDRVAGKEIALSICAECHFVADEQVELPDFDAPPFEAIAAEPSVTELSLRVFLQTPHNRMPDILLTQEQEDNVITYILSLGRGQ